MRRKIKKIAKRIVHRENITAVSMIVIFGFVSLSLGFASFVFSYWRGWQIDESTKTQKNSAYLDELRRLSGITTELKAVPDPTADWKQYENAKYSFAIKYPQDWQAPKEVQPTSDNKYLVRISFANQAAAGSQNQKGFDVYIYSASRFPGPEGTDNLSRKNGEAVPDSCTQFGDITLSAEGYPAKEVDVKGGDPCFGETFFYSLAKGGYRYNVVPLEAGYNISDFDDKVTLIKTFPEFYDVVSTLSLEKKTDIFQAVGKSVQKAVSPPKPRFTAGARCAHPDRKPTYSKTKGRHMDEDCCPDPDEWPMPGCAYSGGDLAVMMSGPPKAKKK